MNLVHPIEVPGCAQVLFLTALGSQAMLWPCGAAVNAHAVSLWPLIPQLVCQGIGREAKLWIAGAQASGSF